MSFSGYASRHPHRQIDQFWNRGSKSCSLERPYLPPHSLWNPSRSDMNEANRPYENRFESPSPPKYRRASRRLSVEEFCDTEWLPVDKESRLEHGEKAPNTSFGQNNRCADYNSFHKPRFSSERSPDSTLSAQCCNEPLTGNNSERLGKTNQDYKKRSRSHGRQSWSHKSHKNAHHSPNVPPKHRSKSDQRHHSKSGRCEPPTTHIDVQGNRSSPGGPLKNHPSINRSFNDDRTEDGASMTLLEELEKSPKKKKKKRKKKKKSKSRSRSKETRRCSTENICEEKQSSEERRAHFTSTPPTNLSGALKAVYPSPCEEKSSRTIKEGSSPDLDSLTNSKSIGAPLNSVPDSYVCAIVKKRRVSSQDKEGSAILKFTRVEGQSRKTPRKSSLASSVKRSQDSTPTSVKKIERPGASTEVVTPETEPVEKQNAAQRSSPMKGDIKPKAIIKPGLRSERKDPKSSHELKRRSKTPLKKDGDSTRKLVQRTLESYFCKSVSEAAKDVPKQPEAEPTDAACRENKKSADQGNSKSHVRRIYSDATESRAVVQLTPVSEGIISKLRSPKSKSESAPRGRWGSTPRLAEVRPIPSPAKKRPCESPPPEQPTKVACRSPRLTRASSLEGAPPDEKVDVLQLEEDPAQTERDEAARKAEVTKAAQRNRKRHTRGIKVFAHCDVLQEDIERRK